MENGEEESLYAYLFVSVHSCRLQVRTVVWPASRPALSAVKVSVLYSAVMMSPWALVYSCRAVLMCICVQWLVRNAVS